jgi:plastocyanin
MKGRFVFAAGLLAAAPAAAAEHVIRMAGQQYEPAEINAVKGDSLRFVNDDDLAHDVFVPTVGFGLDLGKQEPGEEKAITLAKDGSFEVECVFHPDMLLTVMVDQER